MNYIKSYSSPFDKVVWNIVENWAEYSIGVIVGILVVLYFL